MQTSEKFDDTLFAPYLDSIFIQSHSDNTIKTYKNGLNRFGMFVEDNYHCTLSQLFTRIKEGKEDVYKVLSNFVVHLDKLDKKPKSIKLWTGAVKGYLRYSGIKVYSEDFKQLVKLPKVLRQREQPLTKEVILRLLRNLPLKLQTAVLICIASGMRIGELVQLKISDIDFDSRPTKILLRAEITKTREARETYLTTEATNALKDYLTRYLDWNEGKSNETITNQVIFGRKNHKKTKCTSMQIAESVLQRSLLLHITNIPELNQLNENGIHVIHFHAFRKFFRTVIGDVVGRDYTEALMGRRFYLDTYYNLPVEKRREMYLKAEPYLTVSDHAKIEKDLSRIAEKEKELDAKYAIFEQFIRTHFVGFPEFTKINLAKETERPQYVVSCPKCKKFLGESITIKEGQLLQQAHQPNCILLSEK